MAAVLETGDRHTLELRKDFRTSNSAALDVRLCRTTACGEQDLNLGGIKSFSGAQSYDLPNSGAAFAYVVIWCRAVNLPFGYGQLQ